MSYATLAVFRKCSVPVCVNIFDRLGQKCLKSKEALRSIIISQQLLGTQEIAVFHHTDCGMLMFSNPDIKALLEQRYPTAADEIKAIDFLPFSNLEQSVKDDVEYLKQHPLVLKDIKITGWIYEVETGKVCGQSLN